MAKWLISIKKPQYTKQWTRAVDADNETEAFQKVTALVGGPNADQYVLKHAYLMPED